MSVPPTIEIDRLRLRPLQLSDAARVQQLAGDRAIADTTIRIPHPYETGAAEKWISTLQQQFDIGETVVFGIALKPDYALVGAVELAVNVRDQNAEMSFWIGAPYWGRGYATEAARAALRYAFDELQMHRVYAQYFRRNPASSRVLHKLGMTHEGCRRQQIQKWDQFEDLECCGLLRSEWAAANRR